MKEKLETIWRQEKNIFVIGDSLSGKTKNILFPFMNKMINENNSFFLLDSKGEYIKEYQQRLQNKGYQTIIINLKEYEKSQGWNILEYPYELYKKGKKDESLTYLEKIGKTIFYEESSTMDSFWTLTASDFFLGIVLGLFEDGREEQINLNSVFTMFDGAKSYGKDDYITEYFKRKKVTDQSYIYASATINAAPATKASILTVVRQKIRKYVSRQGLSRLLSKTTFDIHTLFTSPCAIIVIGEDCDKQLNGLINIFMEQLYLILNQTKHNSFCFVLDNFDTLEHINNFTEMLASLSKKIRFIIATRSKEEMENHYGNYIRKLSDEIIIQSKRIEFSVEGQEVPEREEDNIIYPKLENKEVPIFSVEKYVNETAPKEKTEQRPILESKQEIPKKEEMEETKKQPEQQTETKIEETPLSDVEMIKIEQEENGKKIYSELEQFKRI